MTVSEFNEMVRKELDSGSKRATYFKKEGDNISGGMSHSKEMALEYCRVFYNENNETDFGVVFYEDDEVNVLEKSDILLMLGIITEDEYLTSWSM